MLVCLHEPCDILIAYCYVLCCINSDHRLQNNNFNNCAPYFHDFRDTITLGLVTGYKMNPGMVFSLTVLIRIE